MNTRLVSSQIHGSMGALSADAKLHSHAIEAPIPSERMVSQAFDDITYNKASCRSYSLLPSILNFALK
jgi:aminopeptidase N